MLLSSDLPGSSYDFFYMVHAAITRRDQDGQPPGGWYVQEKLSPEEAVRGYSTWAAYASFAENDGGQIAPGRLADLSALSVDPLTLGATDPGALLGGRVRLTLVNGRVTFDGK